MSNIKEISYWQFNKITGTNNICVLNKDNCTRISGIKRNIEIEEKKREKIEKKIIEEKINNIEKIACLWKDKYVNNAILDGEISKIKFIYEDNSERIIIFDNDYPFDFFIVKDIIIN